MRQLIGAIIFLLIACPAHGEQFELFVVNPISNERQDVAVYQINGGDQLMASINAQMKRDGVMREAEGARYVTSELKQALAEQAIGLTKAMQYQLLYFPALVIDERFVIYGTTDPKHYDRLKHHD